MKSVGMIALAASAACLFSAAALADHHGDGAAPAAKPCLLDAGKTEAGKAEARKVMGAFRGAVLDRTGGLMPGFSLAVSVCGRVVWEGGFGLADLEGDVPVTPQTRFRVGSVSKTFTSAALGQLVESGVIDLDADARIHIPDYPEKRHVFTPRHLAGHLAGIRHYRGDEFLSTTSYTDVFAPLAVFKEEPLLHEPGAAFVYSTYSYTVLSAVIAGASGDPFADYMAEQVFKPAGMERTVPDRPARLIAGRTRFYALTEDGASASIANAPYVDLSNKWAGGGFLSTPGDILRFAAAMADGTLVSRETYRTLTTSLRTSGGEKTGYGIGWFTDMGPRQLQGMAPVFSKARVDRVRRILGQARVIGHTGGSVGGLTVFASVPDAPGAVAVAATANVDIQPAFALAAAAEFIAAYAPEEAPASRPRNGSAWIR